MLAARLVLVALALLLARAASAADSEIAIVGRVDLERGTIAGKATIAIGAEAGAKRVLDFLLHADRFREPPAGLDDLSRHHLIESGGYRAGGTDVSAVRLDGRALAPRIETRADAGSVLHLEVEPGATLEIEFTTRLPNLRDVFGASAELLVAEAGWYPRPLTESGRLAPHRATVSLTLPEGSEGVLGTASAAAPGPLEVSAPSSELGLLAVSGQPFAVRGWTPPAGAVTLRTLPTADLVHRVGPTPPADDALVEALDIVLARSRRRGELTILRLPLGWLPSWSAPGVVVVSDRLFEVYAMLRPLHTRELAYAIFLAEELREAEARERPEDVAWVAEGRAWRRAQALYEELRSGREVRDWIRLFDLFAIVDRFETAPRIPLLRPFFAALASDDPLRLRLASAAGDRPPGRLVFDKLALRLGEEAFAKALAGGGPLRSELAAEDVAFADAWLAPYPELDYRLGPVERMPGRTRFHIERRGPADAPGERLPFSLDDERFAVEVTADGADVDQAVPADVVELDPDRRLPQPDFLGDRDPPELEVLLDSTDVEVSSTEFGFSTLFVARQAYDYRKDLAAAGFITDRGYGVHGGFQLHGGPPIDRNLFSRNVFLYYALQELDRGFHEKGDERRAGGTLSGFGLRYNDFDAYWFENPSRSHHLRIFADVYDPAFGSRYGFVRAGGSLSATRPIGGDTLVAGQALAGFTARTTDRGVPPQSLFSLGGFRAIRGIAADEALDRHVFVVRGELRHMLPWRLDLSLDDAVVARRLQAKAFVDAGRVARRAGDLADVGDFAVGAGVGVNLFYDFLGFFPTSFYVDLATRVDESDSLQVLFGARQPF